MAAGGGGHTDPADGGAHARAHPEEWLSLDGFAVDGDGRLYFFPATESDRFSDRDQLAFLDSVDTILLGRRTYELFVAFWPTARTDREIVADRLNALPKLVFSNTLRAAPWGGWPPARVVRGDAVAEIRRLKAQHGKHMVLWGSLSLAHDLIAADLIDEYHLQVCPTLVGAGRRLFREGDGYARLTRVGVRTYDTGVVFLHYEPQRAPQVSRAARTAVAIGCPARPGATPAGRTPSHSHFTPERDVGLLDGLLGNAAEVDAAKMQAEFSQVLGAGEAIEKAYVLVRDAMLFTDRRLILVDKQGVTGGKVEYHSLPYRAVTHFSVETAGHFDLDADLKIWVSGRVEPFTQQFKRGLSIYTVQAVLAGYVCR